MNAVNDILSRFYGQPVVGGYTNGGFPVIRPAGKPEEVVAGGMWNAVALPPMVENLLELQAKLACEISEIEDYLDERERLREEAKAEAEAEAV